MLNGLGIDWLQRFARLFFEESILDYNSFNIAVDLKNNNIPCRLFKYREPNDNTLNTLNSSTGWFAPCSDQNDTFEAISKIDYHKFASTASVDDIKMIMPQFEKKIEETVKEPALAIIKSAVDKINSNVQDGEIGDNVSEVIVKDYLELLIQVEQYKKDQSKLLPDSMRKRFSLFSLSEDNLNIPMWSYYADDHKGICIEYNFRELNEGDYLRNNLFPVIYSDNIVDITPFIIKSTKDKKYYENPVFLLLPVLNKTIKWKHEFEWRIVNTNNFDNKGKLVKLPKPKAIILGLKMNEVYKNKVLAICEEQEIQVKNIRVNNSNRMLEEY